MRDFIDHLALRLSNVAVPAVWLVGCLSAIVLLMQVLNGDMAANTLLVFLPTGIALGLVILRQRIEKPAPEDALTTRLFAEAEARMSVPSLAIVLTFEDLDPAQNGRALDVIERRLRSQTRVGDRVERTGSAGFVLLPGTDGPTGIERAVQTATRLQRLCANTISMEGRKLSLTPTVGFARNDGADLDTDTLIARALAAAEAAFLAGRGEIRGWTPAIQDDIALRMSMKSALTRAFEQGDIKPWFQPQVSTDTGEITGVEALARWEHPERGLISPAEFLPFIASSGLTSRLTRAMIDDALTALAAWDEAGLHVPRVSVNLSTQDLTDAGLVAMISRRLTRHNMPPERLGVEVLESVVSLDPDCPVRRNLAELVKLGCFIDLDDFGTGSASISTLRLLPIRRVKIDRSFVTNVDIDAEQQSFVRAQLTVADQLSLDTLAEGVETPGEHTILAQLGCAHVQGFGIGRPMPARDMVAWADSYRANLPIPRLTAPRGPDEPASLPLPKGLGGKVQQAPTGKTA